MAPCSGSACDHIGAHWQDRPRSSRPALRSTPQLQSPGSKCKATSITPAGAPHTNGRVSRLPAQSAFVQSLIPGYAAGLFRNAGSLLLDRWADHRSIAAEHAAVSRLRSQRLAAALAGVEPHARICRHRLRRLMAAVWARDCRPKLQGDGCILHNFHITHLRRNAIR